MADREVVLLFVGRLCEKNLEMLPELLYRLRAQRVRHRMVIAGDGPLREWLVSQLPEAVFTGTLNRGEVADVFASADIFVFPSTADTAGHVVLEAQVSGLPVIVSAGGGPKEQMCPGLSGLVCGDADPRYWADTIARVAGDAEWRALMVRRAREYALSRSWRHALAPMYQAYRNAVRAVPDASPVRDVAEPRNAARGAAQ